MNQYLFNLNPALVKHNTFQLMFQLRGDIHTQVTTLNVNMTFGWWELLNLTLELWQNDIFSVFNMKQLYHMQEYATIKIQVTKMPIMQDYVANIQKQKYQLQLLFLTVCSYHVMYAFQSESTLYICLNVKELLAQNRCDILSLSNGNPQPLSSKRTLNHVDKIAKWLSFVVSTYLYGAFDCIL